MDCLRVRLRLMALGLAQTVRRFADVLLIVGVWLELLHQQKPTTEAGLFAAGAMFLPVALFSPLLGAFGQALSRRDVLALSSIACLATAGIGWLQMTTPLCLLGLHALGSGLFSATRTAMFPAVVPAARIRLARLNAVQEIALALAGAYALHWALTAVRNLPPPPEDNPAVAVTPLFAVLGKVVLLDLVVLLLSLFAPPEADTPHPTFLSGVPRFFTAIRQIDQDREARSSLFAITAFLGLLFITVGLLVTAPEEADAVRARVESCFLAALLGLALGNAVAALQPHPRRGVGFLPFALVGLALVLLWCAQALNPASAVFWLGMLLGLLTAPLRNIYQATVPSEVGVHGMIYALGVLPVMTMTLALVLTILLPFGVRPTTAAWILSLAVLAALAAVVAWWKLLRPAFELAAEMLFWPFYRVRFSGDGFWQIPQKGPLLIVANHSSWCDPLWVGKVLPRDVTPMMTHVFYDLPILRWIMKHLAKAIRVEVGKFRREAPELKEAVAALRRGECVMLFPEGRLRRTEEQLLRHFGQGVWHILHELPDTPVLVCWIEGGWGSYLSYKDGPPAKNKKLDWFRLIRVGFTAPRQLPSEILADHRTTRRYLMQACLDARQVLGLPAASPVGEVAEDEEGEPNGVA
jgi:1-acyl-sn-glycerol-3-phosphate acyltransferase